MKKTNQEHIHNFQFQGKCEPGYNYSDTFSMCYCGASISYHRDGTQSFHSAPSYLIVKHNLPIGKKHKQIKTTITEISASKPDTKLSLFSKILITSLCILFAIPFILIFYYAFTLEPMPPKPTWETICMERGGIPMPAHGVNTNPECIFKP